MLRFVLLPGALVTLLRLVFPIAVVLGLSVSSAAAQSRDEVRTMLSGIESAPSEAEWRALGEGTVPVLVALFDDTSELQPVRLRSVWAARFYPTAASRSFLERVAADGAQPGLVVRAAVQSLAFAFGRSAVAPVAARIGHSDSAVREAVIVSLGRMGGPQARAALEARRGRETELAELLTTTLATLSDAR